MNSLQAVDEWLSALVMPPANPTDPIDDSSYCYPRSSIKDVEVRRQGQALIGDPVLTFDQKVITQWLLHGVTQRRHIFQKTA